MRTLLLLALTCFLVLVPTSEVLAGCQCTCVNGQNVPLCTSSIDLRPICPPRICPITPPSVQPIQPPVVPPIGTTNCQQEQVLNIYTGQYEWRTVCR